MLATLGDLVEDIVVRHDGLINEASDTAAQITRRLGGSAANVSAATARLGYGSRFLGQVGTDAIGRALVDELNDEGVDVSAVRRSGTTGTIVALVDQTGERSMLTDRRACLNLERNHGVSRAVVFARRGADFGDRQDRDRMGSGPLNLSVDRCVVDGDHGDVRNR